MTTNDESTSHEHMKRLRKDPTDQAEWRLHYERYRPIVERFLVRLGLKGADLEDAISNVFQKIVQRMTHPTNPWVYEPDRSYRGWLRALCRSVAADARGKKERDRQTGILGSGDSAVQEQLSQVPAETEPDAVEDDERRLLGELVRQYVEAEDSTAFECFRRMVLHDQTAKQVAAELGLNLWGVYKHRDRVRKALCERLAHLRGPR
jgi:DNA-directed RNA polymerase specialized sigma24 family protein